MINSSEKKHLKHILPQQQQHLHKLCIKIFYMENKLQNVSTIILISGECDIQWLTTVRHVRLLAEEV